MDLPGLRPVRLHCGSAVEADIGPEKTGPILVSFARRLVVNIGRLLTAQSIGRSDQRRKNGVPGVLI